MPLCLYLCMYTQYELYVAIKYKVQYWTGLMSIAIETKHLFDEVNRLEQNLMSPNYSNSDINCSLWKLYRLNLKTTDI